MTEPEPVSVHEAISRVMADVRAVRKESLNKAQGAGYRFRGIDAVMNAVGPALRQHGVTVVPHRIVAIDYVPVVVGEKKTAMTSVRLQVIYRWRGPSGDKLDTMVPGEAFDAGDKGTAKAMSVAYRTLLLQALTLPTDEPDPDSTTYQQAGHVNPDQERDLGRWRGEVAAAGTDRAKLKALWDRMRAEWYQVPWSPERDEILQEAIDRSAQPAAAGAPVDAPESTNPQEGEDSDEAALLAQQAAEWDADWRAKLKAAAEAKDPKAVRALIKLALESKAKHLADEGTAVLNGWRTKA